MLHLSGSGFTGSQNAARLVPGASQPGCIGAGLKLGRDALGNAGRSSGAGTEDAGLADGAPCAPTPGAGRWPWGRPVCTERGSGALSWGRPLKAPWL